MFYYWHSMQFDAAMIDVFNDVINGITFFIFI
jgi:hypothetical protein